MGSWRLVDLEFMDCMGHLLHAWWWQHLSEIAEWQFVNIRAVEELIETGRRDSRYFGYSISEYNIDESLRWFQNIFWHLLKLRGGV